MNAVLPGVTRVEWLEDLIESVKGSPDETFDDVSRAAVRARFPTPIDQPVHRRGRGREPGRVPMFDPGIGNNRLSITRRRGHPGDQSSDAPPARRLNPLSLAMTSGTTDHTPRCGCRSATPASAWYAATTSPSRSTSPGGAVPDPRPTRTPSSTGQAALAGSGIKIDLPNFRDKLRAVIDPESDRTAP